MGPEDREKIVSCCDKLVPNIDLKKLWPKLLEHGIYDKGYANVPSWEGNLEARDTVREVYLGVRSRGPHAFGKLVLALRETGQGDLADILEGKDSNSPGYVAQNGNMRNSGEKNGNNEDNSGEKNGNDEDHSGEKNGNDEDISIKQDNAPGISEASSSGISVPIKNEFIKLIKATKFLDDPELFKKVELYPMRSNPRGLVLIINNTTFQQLPDRTGAEIDAVNLKRLFEEMGFLVVLHPNLTKEKMINEISEFSKRGDLRLVDSCFVIIMSHGDQTEVKEETIIAGIECPDPKTTDQWDLTGKLRISDILDYFSAEKCPNLVHKPKVFIFQNCRGEETQYGYSQDKPSTFGLAKESIGFYSRGDSTQYRYSQVKDTMKMRDPVSETTAPITKPSTSRMYSDMIVAHSTLPGYYANRDPKLGSWFIEALCKVFMKHAYDTNLVDLFIMVDKKMASLYTNHNECQTSVIEMKGFNKHCYLNPGLSVENPTT